MSRSWNHKVIIANLGIELWGLNPAYIIRWINEIQDDLAGAIPVDFFKFKMKKLLPTGQLYVGLSPTIPSAPTTALSVGGNLTEGMEYKVYVTYKIFNADGSDTYIESEPSLAGTLRTATAANKTIDLTALDLYPGEASISPANIYRNIYVSKKAAADSEHGEPFFLAEITDNTTLIYSVTDEPTSTITPPSSTEVDQISSDHLAFSTGNRFLERIDSNKLKRANPNQDSSGRPYAFDFEGLDKIYLSSELSATATTSERTLTYTVFRRPHESFNDSSIKIDLPIQARAALMAGVIWKGWEFTDRNGWVSKENLYQKKKNELLSKITRQRGAPSAVRDVNGDTDGYEI